MGAAAADAESGVAGATTTTTAMKVRVVVGGSREERIASDEVGDGRVGVSRCLVDVVPYAGGSDDGIKAPQNALVIVRVGSAVGGVIGITLGLSVWEKKEKEGLTDELGIHVKRHLESYCVLAGFMECNILIH